MICYSFVLHIHLTFVFCKYFHVSSVKYNSRSLFLVKHMSGEQGCCRMWGKLMLEVTARQERCVVGSLDSWKVSCCTYLQSLFWFSRLGFNPLPPPPTLVLLVLFKGLVWRWTSCVSRRKRWSSALCMGEWAFQLSSGKTVCLYFF